MGTQNSRSRRYAISKIPVGPSVRCVVGGSSQSLRRVPGAISNCSSDVLIGFRQGHISEKFRRHIKAEKHCKHAPFPVWSFPQMMDRSKRQSLIFTETTSHKSQNVEYSSTCSKDRLRQATDSGMDRVSIAYRRQRRACGASCGYCLQGQMRSVDS